MQRAEREARTARRVRGIGERFCFLAVDLGKGMELPIRFVDPRQKRIDDVA
jgi:hypothetical protein